MANTEVHLICSSCQKEFVRIPYNIEGALEKWETIQVWLAEKEPKCKECEKLISWMPPSPMPQPVLDLQKALNAFADAYVKKHLVKRD